MRKLLVMVVVAMVCLAFMVSFAAAAIETGGLVATGTVLAAVGTVGLMVALVWYARAADEDWKSSSDAGNVEFMAENYYGGAEILAQAKRPYADSWSGGGFARVILDDRSGGDGALGAWPEPAAA